MTTVINAPVEKVWNFMADLRTMSLRDPSVVSVDWQPPLRAGSVAIITARNVILGKRDIKYEVKELDPYHKFSVQASAMGFQVDGTYEFQTVDKNMTKLSASMRIETHGLMKLVSLALFYSSKRDASAEFERIKNAIEAQAISNTTFASPR